MAPVLAAIRATRRSTSWRRSPSRRPRPTPTFRRTRCPSRSTRARRPARRSTRRPAPSPGRRPRRRARALPGDGPRDGQRDAGAERLEAITITVNEVNAAPVLAAIGEQDGGRAGARWPSRRRRRTRTAGQRLDVLAGRGRPGRSDDRRLDGRLLLDADRSAGTGLLPVTVRVTDNGTPALSDFEAIAITVVEVNSAPVLSRDRQQDGRGRRARRVHGDGDGRGHAGQHARPSRSTRALPPARRSTRRPAPSAGRPRPRASSPSRSA